MAPLLSPGHCGISRHAISCFAPLSKIHTNCTGGATDAVSTPIDFKADSTLLVPIYTSVERRASTPTRLAKTRARQTDITVAKSLALGLGLRLKFVPSVSFALSVSCSLDGSLSLNKYCSLEKVHLDLIPAFLPSMREKRDETSVDLFWPSIYSAAYKIAL